MSIESEHTAVLQEELRGLIAKWRDIHLNVTKDCLCENSCADELESLIEKRRANGSK